MTDTANTNTFQPGNVVTWSDRARGDSRQIERIQRLGDGPFTVEKAVAVAEVYPQSVADLVGHEQFVNISTPHGTKRFAGSLLTHAMQEAEAEAAE